jgi:hypothetical protein
MNLWLVQHFLNPAFVAGGLALVASPIIIHLLNRYRFRQVRFAAMDFLLQSQKKNRQKVLLEQLLLLLLRILIVLGIVMLISRLIIDPQQMSLFQGAQTHHVVLIDNSGSMRNRWGDTSAYHEALEVIKRMIAEGSRQPGSQKMTILLLTEPETTLSNFVERTIDESLLTDFTERMKVMEEQCTHQHPSLIDGLKSARAQLELDKSAVRNLHLISDFRESDWMSQPALATELLACEHSGVTVNLVKTVPAQYQNIAISQLDGALESAAVGIPLRLSVTVANEGTRIIDQLPLSVRLDGNKLPLSVNVEKLEPGKSTTLPFDVVFDQPGLHEVSVACAEDSLEMDNQRFVAVEVAATNQVLVIDGSPATGDGQYVLDALAADPSVTGYSVTVENVDYLRKNSLRRFGMIYLANVPTMPADAYQALKEYVQEGGGLAWFMGNATVSSYYNEQFYENGTGLFKLPLAPTPSVLPRSDAMTPASDMSLTDHPVFKILNAEGGFLVNYLSIFRSIQPIDKWNRDDQQRVDGVKTIATLRNGQPLMLEYHFVQGKVLLCLTSIGPEAKPDAPNERWNNWPLGPNAIAFPVFHLELCKYLIRNDRKLPHYLSGQPYEIKLDPAVYSEQIEIRAPESAGGKVYPLKASIASITISDAELEEDKLKEEQQGTQSPPSDPESVNFKPLLRERFTKTDNPGVYKIQLLTQAQEREQRWFTINPPLEESRMAISSTEALQRMFGTESHITVQEPGVLNWIEGREAGQDVRYFLLAILISLLLLEQMLAYRFSYHNRETVSLAPRAKSSTMYSGGRV